MILAQVECREPRITRVSELDTESTAPASRLQKSGLFGSVCLSGSIKYTIKVDSIGSSKGPCRIETHIVQGTERDRCHR